MDAVLDMAKKSIVLLKNEGGLLPLQKNGLKIGLIGPWQMTRIVHWGVGGWPPMTIHPFRSWKA